MMKILLTEDNKVSRQLALIIFGQLGYQVDVATDGEEAVQLWQKHHYDFIFMDIMMPGMNGYDAARMIRSYESETGGHTNIIAVTAKKNKGEHEEALLAGMDDYLTKPITERTIKEAINKWETGAYPVIKNVAYYK